MTHWDEVWEQDRVIFQTQVGSHLFGTSDPASDLDTRGVWVGNPVEHRGPSIYDPTGEDYQVLELRTFVARLLTGEQTTLEILFGNQTIHHEERFAPIWAVRDLFLSREWVARAHAFATKFLRMDPGASRYQTHIAHVWRVTANAAHYVRTGRFSPRVRDWGWDDATIASYRRLKRAEAPELIPLGRTMARENIAVLEHADIPPVLVPVVQRALRDTLAINWESLS